LSVRHADAFYIIEPVFYATDGGLTTDEELFRRNAEGRLTLDLGQAPRQALAFGVDRSGGTGAGHRVGGPRGGHLPGQRRLDQPRLDGAVIAKTARISIAIALDQPSALRDLEGEFAGLPRRLSDQAKPGLDLRLFLRLNKKTLSETWLYQYFPS